MSSVVHKEIDIWIRDIGERILELERQRTDAYKLLERYEQGDILGLFINCITKLNAFVLS